MKKIISLIVCVMLLTACGSELKLGTKYETINSNVAMDLIEDGAVIIDVRTSEEYDTGHIKDAVNIPVDNITLADYPKNAVIIVYCATGMRSATAADALMDAGFTNVYNLDGGLINWGFELVE